MDVLGYCEYHIDMSVDGVGCNPWRMTYIYGEAQTQERYKTWDLMKNICDASPLPWLCIRDFNEVLNYDE